MSKQALTLEIDASVLSPHLQIWLLLVCSPLQRKDQGVIENTWSWSYRVKHIKIYILPKSHHTSKAKFFRLFFCQLINIIATCHANIPIAEQLFTVFHLEMLVSMLYPAKSSAPYRAVHHINRSFFVHVSCLFSLATKQCGISLFFVCGKIGPLHVWPVSHALWHKIFSQLNYFWTCWIIQETP